MSFFGNALDRMIDELESTMPKVDETYRFGAPVERHDWRPIWALCQSIQTTFSTFCEYASRQDKDAAWRRFQALRVEASRRAEVERQQVSEDSEALRREIIREARACYWSLSADAFIGPFLGETTVEEMKALQARLNDAGRKLSDNKTRMTGADKEECFQAIQDSRESHDRFWQKYGEYREERRAASQHRREEFERKRSEWIDRVHANIASNREKVRKAQGALDRVRAHIEETETKLANTTSEKWTTIFSEWLEKDHEKESEIEESVERIRGWIEDDEGKLRQAN